MHGLCNVKAFLLPCHFDTTIVCLPVSMSALTSDQLCVCSLKYSKLLQTTSCAHMLLNFAYACSVTCSLSECENIFVAHQTILEFFLISELQYGVPWLRVVASSTCIYSLSKTGTLATRYGSLFFFHTLLMALLFCQFLVHTTRRLQKWAHVRTSQMLCCILWPTALVIQLDTYFRNRDTCLLH